MANAAAIAVQGQMAVQDLQIRNDNHMAENLPCGCRCSMLANANAKYKKCSHFSDSTKNPNESEKEILRKIKEDSARQRGVSWDDSMVGKFGIVAYASTASSSSMPSFTSSMAQPNNRYGPLNRY